MHPGDGRFPRALFLGLLLGGLSGLVAPGLRAEEESAAGEGASEIPLVVPDDGRLLDFRFQSLRMISPTAGPAKGRVYWYMIYTLENPAAEEREFFLSIRAVTDGRRTYADLCLPLVEREIERREGTPLWGQTDRYEILSQRRPDDDRFHYTTIKGHEKRRCVAVFNRLDPHVSEVKISVAGLYDVEVVPARGGEEEKVRERVRVLTFKRPGDARQVTTDTFQLLQKEWIVRDVPLEPASS